MVACSATIAKKLHTVPLLAMRNMCVIIAVAQFAT
jgi:hypothetical protein